MSEKRRFEFVEGSSSKFWEVWRTGSEVRTRYGRIGADGQTTVKDEGTDAAAEKLYNKLIGEKTKKGYEEVGGGAPAAVPATTTTTTTTKAKKKIAMHPWLAAGAGYRSADFDADDTYVVRCSENAAGDVVVRFEGTAGEGGFVCTGAAIDSGTEKIHLAQGGAGLSQSGGGVDEETPTEAFPPFMLSRSMFAALRGGETIEWPTVLTGDGKTVEVMSTGGGTATIRVNGKKQTVKTIKAEGEDVRLVVLDDAQWPIILVDNEADECGWWLRAVSPDLSADELHEEEPEEDDEDDEGDGDGDDDDEGEGGSFKRFEVDEKFWEIKLDGASHTVRFGKIGTAGTEKTKDFDDEAAAKKDHDKLVKEKTGKGYEPVDGDDDGDDDEEVLPPKKVAAKKATAKAAPKKAAKDEDEDDEDEGDDDEGGDFVRYEVDEKFWAIKLDGSSHTVRFGKIGTAGTEKTKDFDDAAAAKKDHDKLVKEKTGKDYERV
jgi:predicted DNA-binding WGR domain protein